MKFVIKVDDKGGIQTVYSIKNAPFFIVNLKQNICYTKMLQIINEVLIASKMLVFLNV